MPISASPRHTHSMSFESLSIFPLGHPMSVTEKENDLTTTPRAFARPSLFEQTISVAPSRNTSPVGGPERQRSTSPFKISLTGNAASANAPIRSASPATPQSPSKRERRSSTDTNSTARQRSSLHQQRAAAAASRTSPVASGSSSSRRASGTTDSHSVRLPLRLPTAPLHVISSPSEDLHAHLSRHGLRKDADVFQANGVPASYVLSSFMSVAQHQGTPLQQSLDLFVQHSAQVERQFVSARREYNSLPQSIKLDMASRDGTAPTHIFAIHSSLTPGNASEDAKGLLLPIHALVYAMQCVSLPALPSIASLLNEDGTTELPIVPLCVPKPSSFHITHNYLCTQDNAILLSSLVPLRYVMANWGIPQGSKPDRQRAAVAALARLPTRFLLGQAQLIHAAWANGSSVGIIAAGYWETLNSAWDLILPALMKRKVLRLEGELRSAAEGIRNTTLDA